jgi:hypothetical protein
MLGSGGSYPYLSQVIPNGEARTVFCEVIASFLAVITPRRALKLCVFALGMVASGSASDCDNKNDLRHVLWIL